MNARPASTRNIVAAFGAVYVIWGSTYLAIRFAVETLPPFLMGGARFFTAGAVLMAVLLARGAPRPTLRQWRGALVSGTFLIAGGNGLLSWSEQYVPSGLAALLVATVPLWMVAIARLGPDRERTGRLEALGLFLGLTGVVVLVGGSGAEVGIGGADEAAVLLASLAVVAASISWAIGSMHNRRAELPRPPLYATALTMTAGGAVLVLVGLAAGEAGRLTLSEVAGRSWLSLLYLIVFGSIVAFSAYAWLLRVVRPAAVGTYAYVNPIVALALGWWLADEPFTGPMLVGTVIIVAGVLLVQRGRAGGAARGGSPRTDRRDARWCRGSAPAREPVSSARAAASR